MRYFRFTTDHKVVGIQYLVVTMIMLAFGGLGAMLIRTELIQPGAKPFPTGTYNTVVTMHGMLMILATITFFIGPFGNFIVPIMIGARDMAFPRLNALSIALLILGPGHLRRSSPSMASAIPNGTGGGVQTGWTIYGTVADQTGIGMTALAAAVILAVHLHPGRGQRHHDRHHAARPGMTLDTPADDRLGHLLARRCLPPSAPSPSPSTC